ncbi:heme-binding domain-containing protein [Candidatus Binatus sp.]|uniref:heme-binding domain-containing protein n=1 Tax=Candidatus Binatus sp. TaxID=2811406 RepID=UPI003BAE1928
MSRAEAATGRPFRAILWSTAIAIVIAQFVRPARSNPAVQGDLSAPPVVKDALERSCYDCHSNQTRWPWYSAVAPFSWWIHHEVEEGRRRLNFSSWTDYTSDPGTEDQKLDEVARLIASGAMPPWYYLAMHPQARLTPEERIAIARWIADEKSLHPSPASR